MTKDIKTLIGLFHEVKSKVKTLPPLIQNVGYLSKKFEDKEKRLSAIESNRNAILDEVKTLLKKKESEEKY